MDISSFCGYPRPKLDSPDSIRAFKADPLPVTLVDSLMIAEPQIARFQDPKGCAIALLVMEARIGVKPHDVLKIMKLETANTFDPAIKCNTSSAKGLFQYMPKTSLGVAAKLNLPDLSTQWRQIRGAELMFAERQAFCRRRFPHYDISKDLSQLYLAILYPKASCDCNPNTAILMGRAARANPHFHVDANDNVTYLKEISAKLR